MAVMKNCKVNTIYLDGYFKYGETKAPKMPTCKHDGRAYQCTKLNIADVMAFYKAFHKNEEKVEQDTFILPFLDLNPVRRRRPKTGVNRNKTTTCKCFIKGPDGKLPVCQKTFTNALRITTTPGRLRTIMNNFREESNLPCEKRGEDKRTHLYKEKLRSVVEFIKSIKCVESHYCRGRSSSTHIEGARDIGVIPAIVITDSSLPSTSSSGIIGSSRSEVRRIQQQVLSAYALKRISVTQQKKLDQLLLNLIIKDFQPFSMVEDNGFKDFILTLNPAYKLPTRKTLSNVLLPAVFEEVRLKVSDALKEVVSITITTDCWTSSNTDSVIGKCVGYEGGHGSTNLADNLSKVISNSNISEESILLGISDNAANIKKAISSDLNWRHFGCYAHTLNLIMGDALKLIQEVTLNKVSKIVTHFKQSENAKSKLDNVQRQQGKEPKKLKKDVVTRWNSTYLMLERFVELEEAKNHISINGFSLPTVRVRVTRALKLIKARVDHIEKKNYQTFKKSWVEDEQFKNWIKQGKNEYFAMCRLSNKDISIKSMGRIELVRHQDSAMHVQNCKSTKVQSTLKDMAIFKGVSSQQTDQSDENIRFAYCSIYH
ncbi:unnamed protein product [Diabrotica balteata]|uniref:Transposase n=1 Tax=Diabrotica balteata TaxID=107213 RepID=A0A9N9TG13_DIABA|nr:unnamed protein product [Diabrotica balteata]